MTKQAPKSSGKPRRRRKPASTAKPAPAISSLDHFRAHRFEFGDVVMSIRQCFDLDRWAPRSFEVRAFAAAAEDRAKLVELAGDEFAAIDGALAYVALSFAPTDGPYPWAAAGQRIATIDAFARATAFKESHAAQLSALTPWILESIESELRFAGIAWIELADALADGLADEFTACGFARTDDSALRRSLNPVLTGVAAG